MLKHKLSAIALLSVALNWLAPAQAAEQSDRTNPIDALLDLPFHAAALGTGLAVGIPVSLCSTIPENIDDTWNDLVKDAHNPLTPLVAAVPAFPVGTVFGIIDGTAKGTRNAIDNCVTKPFSLESFSLKSDEE